MLFELQSANTALFHVVETAALAAISTDPIQILRLTSLVSGLGQRPVAPARGRA